MGGSKPYTIFVDKIIFNKTYLLLKAFHKNFNLIIFMQELFRWHCPKFGHALCFDCFTSYSEDFSKIAVKANIL